MFIIGKPIHEGTAWKGQHCYIFERTTLYIIDKPANLLICNDEMICLNSWIKL